MYTEKGKFCMEQKVTHSLAPCVFICCFDHWAKLKCTKISNACLWQTFLSDMYTVLFRTPIELQIPLTLIYAHRMNTKEFDSIHLSTTILMWNGKLSQQPSSLSLRHWYTWLTMSIWVVPPTSDRTFRGSEVT